MFTDNINLGPISVPEPVNPDSIEFRLTKDPNNAHRYNYRSNILNKVFTIIDCSGSYIVDGILTGGPHSTLDKAISEIDKMCSGLKELQNALGTK